MDFDKFCDIIIHSQLYFSAPSKFEDPWELYPPTKWLSTEFWKQHFQERSKDIQNHELTEAVTNLILQIQGMYQLKDKYGVSCWTEGSNEREHLWRLYGRSNNSIAIKSSAGKLLKSMSVSNRAVFLGRVSYIDYESNQSNFYSMPIFHVEGSTTIRQRKVDDQILPFMYKREDFSHESEVRAIFWWMNESSSVQRRVKVSADTLIDEIVISPFADSWFEDVVRSLVSKNTRVSMDNVRKSTIYQKPKVLEGTEAFLKRRSFSLEIQEENKTQVYAIFSDLASFAIWHESVNKSLGLPTFGNDSLTGGLAIGVPILQWCLPIPHPSNSCVLATATPSIAEGLELINHEQAIQFGWFDQSRFGIPDDVSL